MKRVLSQILIMLTLLTFLPHFAKSQEELQCLGTIGNLGYCETFDVEGDFCFIPSYNGVKIINISDPYYPEQEGFIYNNSIIVTVRAINEIVYLSTVNDPVIKIYDFSDINNISLVGTLDGWRSLNRVFKYSNLLVISGWGIDDVRTTRIYNVTNPASPVKIAELSGTGVEVVKFPYMITTTYSTSEDSDDIERYHLCSLENPTYPVTLSDLGEGDYTGCCSRSDVDIRMTGKFVIKDIYATEDDLNGWYEGYRIIDITDPENPEEIVHRAGSYIGSFFEQDNYLFNCNLDTLQLYNISDPQNPTVDYTWICSDFPQDIKISFSRGLLYVVENGLLSILDGSDIFATERVEPVEILPLKAKMNVFPNPFNPTININLVFHQPGNLRVQVYNVNGQLIETLTDANYSAGEHSLMFNGSNLSSGVYFINTVVPGESSLIRKVTLVK